MGSVGGPGGRLLGLLPESKSLTTIATATRTGNTVVSRAMTSELKVFVSSASGVFVRRHSRGGLTLKYSSQLH